MNTIKQYDAYLTFSPLPSTEIEAVRQLFANQGLEIQIYANALEFSFVGRDLGDNIVKVFIAVACVLQNADGELRCEIDDEQADPHFEFFTISDSKLYRQKGLIVRENLMEVSSLPAEPS